MFRYSLQKLFFYSITAHNEERKTILLTCQYEASPSVPNMKPGQFHKQAIPTTSF